MPAGLIALHSLMTNVIHAVHLGIHPQILLSRHNINTYLAIPGKLLSDGVSSRRQVKPAGIRPLVAGKGDQAFQQKAGERRRRASNLQHASPPVAARNGLACLLLESAVFTHTFRYTVFVLLLFALT